MKKTILIIVLLLSIVAVKAQVLFNNIEMASDVPPTLEVMYDFKDYKKVVKLAVGNIEARKTSYINFTLQKQAYVVTYTGSYKVALVHTDGKSPKELEEYLKTFTIDSPLFESTRVKDIRDWLIDELLNFYENKSSTW